MEIEIKLEIRNVDKWDVDWENEQEAYNKLKEMEQDLAYTVTDDYWLDRGDISVKTELVK